MRAVFRDRPAGRRPRRVRCRGTRPRPGDDTPPQNREHFGRTCPDTAHLSAYVTLSRRLLTVFGKASASGPAAPGPRGRGDPLHHPRALLSPVRRQGRRGEVPQGPCPDRDTQGQEEGGGPTEGVRPAGRHALHRGAQARRGADVRLRRGLRGAAEVRLDGKPREGSRPLGVGRRHCGELGTPHVPPHGTVPRLCGGPPRRTTWSGPMSTAPSRARACTNEEAGDARSARTSPAGPSAVPAAGACRRRSPRSSTGRRRPSFSGGRSPSRWRALSPVCPSGPSSARSSTSGRSGRGCRRRARR